MNEHTHFDELQPDAKRQFSAKNSAEAATLTRIAHALSKGDQRAWEELYLLMFDPIVLFVSRITKSHEEALDVAQDIFITLWQNASRIDPGKSLKSYLYTIARNHSFKHLRERAKTNRHTSLSDHSLPPLLDVSPEEIIAADETKMLVAIALDAMQPQRRQAFEMHRNDGLSVDEIAEKLQINRRTVQNHIYGAVKELREMLLLAIALLGFDGIAA